MHDFGSLGLGNLGLGGFDLGGCDVGGFDVGGCDLGRRGIGAWTAGRRRCGSSVNDIAGEADDDTESDRYRVAQAFVAAALRLHRPAGLLPSSGGRP